MAGVGQGEAGGCAPWLPSSGDGLWNLRVIDTQGCLLAVVSPGDMGVSYESQFTHTTSIPPPVGVMAASLGAVPSQDVPEMPRLAVGVVGREPERSPSLSSRYPVGLVWAHLFSGGGGKPSSPAAFVSAGVSATHPLTSPEVGRGVRG